MLRQLSATVFLLSLLGTLNARAADDPRDFTGVWVAFASDAATSRNAADALTPEGRILLADFAALYPNQVDPGSYCVPAGMPAAMTAINGYPLEFVHSANRITILTTQEMQVRRIYLDDRGHPDNYPVSAMGHSTGHWEGNTLVIDTARLSSMFAGPVPRTGNTTIVERVSKITRGMVTATASDLITTPPVGDEVLAFTLTVTDPMLYKQAQTLSVYYQRSAEDAMVEYNCTSTLWQQALEQANQ